MDKHWRGWNWRQVAGDQWSHLVPAGGLLELSEAEKTTEKKPLSLAFQ